MAWCLKAREVRKKARAAVSNKEFKLVITVPTSTCEVKEAVRFQHKHPNQTLQENYKERRAGQSGHYESSTPVLDYAPTYLYSLPRAEALTDILF